MVVAGGAGKSLEAHQPAQPRVASNAAYERVPGWHFDSRTSDLALDSVHVTLE